jgi:hypothetical protein
MDSEFCIQALKDAFGRYGVPAIFNTDREVNLHPMDLSKS